MEEKDGHGTELVDNMLLSLRLGKASCVVGNVMEEKEERELELVDNVLLSLRLGKASCVERPPEEGGLEWQIGLGG